MSTPDRAGAQIAESGTGYLDSVSRTFQSVVMLKRLSVFDFNALDPDQQETQIPSVPGLYMWMFDFIRLLDQPKDYVDKRLRAFFSQQGRSIRSAEDPFLEAHWRAGRRPLPPERQAFTVDHIADSTEFGEQMAQAATYLQRPLYVGISTNLFLRLGQHLNGGTRLTQDLAPLELVDCCLLWMELPEKLLDDDMLGNRPELEQQDEDEADVDRTRTAYDGELSWEDREPGVPSHLRFLESLIIRNSSPLFNHTVDS